MEIRGTFEETGSGLKAVYYKLYDSVPDTTAISNFEKGTDSADGNIAIVDENQAVPYNSDDSSISVKSNFHGQIQVFDNTQTNRYLVLIAEEVEKLTTGIFGEAIALLLGVFDSNLR